MHYFNSNRFNSFNSMTAALSTPDSFHPKASRNRLRKNDKKEYFIDIME